MSYRTSGVETVLNGCLITAITPEVGPYGKLITKETCQADVMLRSHFDAIWFDTLHRQSAIIQKIFMFFFCFLLDHSTFADLIMVKECV